MKVNLTTIRAARKEINPRHFRSAWDKGVSVYALELLEELKESIRNGYTSKGEYSREELEKTLLNGASDWGQYSWGGCSLIYDSDIADRLCTPSELKRTDNGTRRPNAKEEWLDTQARALHQASSRICTTLLYR